MKFPNEITLNIIGPIKLAIVAFYQSDVVINKFLSHFRTSLVNKDAIAVERKFDKIGELFSFFRKMPKDYSYSCIMFVTHGTKTGDPSYGEIANNPGKSDDLVKDWVLISEALDVGAVDRVILIAVCYAGDNQVVDILTRGKSQTLHVITPVPGKLLDAIKGAEAMVLFGGELGSGWNLEYSIRYEAISLYKLLINLSTVNSIFQPDAAIQALLCITK